MFALVTALAFGTPVPPVDPAFPEVRLEDAHRFGVVKGACRPLYWLAGRHAGQMRDEVASWNHPADVAEWEKETAWRHRCWYLLDDALECDHLSVYARLRSLDELRRLIGDHAYHAGVMPDPIPAYKR
ncbi:MAG TPA: hypothetical protein VEI97_08085 [bacterium]|nr:hypothetical protein [bacterium]